MLSEKMDGDIFDTAQPGKRRLVDRESMLLRSTRQVDGWPRLRLGSQSRTMGLRAKEKEKDIYIVSIRFSFGEDESNLLAA